MSAQLPIPSPETLSLALLSAAVLLAGVTAWRGTRFRIIEIRQDGARYPLAAQWGEQEAAQRDARLRWAGNSDPDVAGYAVSDGERVVFCAPEGQDNG